MSVRMNGRRLRGGRFNGRTLKLARLNGRVVYSSGLRLLFEAFDGPLDPLVWVGKRDPASETAIARVSGGLLRAGIPSGLWSGKPSSSLITVEDADNEQGTWTVETGATVATAGLYTGIILAADADASRMLVVEWTRRELVFRRRESRSSSWVQLGSAANFTYSPSDRIEVTRRFTESGFIVSVYQNGVWVAAWLDRTGMPGSRETPRIGVRTQGDRSLFTTNESASVDTFVFTTDVR